MGRGASWVVAIALLWAVPAVADTSAPTSWDGTNPFNCELQNAGFGTVVPHPDADPYCVEFDKRRQNITQLGIADFLSKEPARVAAASDKCFYFQVDHWRASVVQDDGSTKLYEWDGHYFFDKARGDGGAWVTNFNINGQPADPDFRTGGVISHDDIPADPSCVAKAKNAYASHAPPPQPAPPLAPCADATGAVTSRSIGPLALGMSESRARSLLGAPRAQRPRLRALVHAARDLPPRPHRGAAHELADLRAARHPRGQPRALALGHASHRPPRRDRRARPPRTLARVRTGVLIPDPRLPAVSGGDARQRAGRRTPTRSSSSTTARSSLCAATVCAWCGARSGAARPPRARPGSKRSATLT